jgi:hypothetical protein
VRLRRQSQPDKHAPDSGVAWPLTVRSEAPYLAEIDRRNAAARLQQSDLTAKTPVVVGNSIRLVSAVELGDALG